MKKYDITILTKRDFFEPKDPNWYAKQAIAEDKYVQEALIKKGLRVNRTYWDNPNFDFSNTKIALFRTIWDYFNRFKEFSEWFDKTKTITRFINPSETIRWNLDKHYLQDLKEQGINIPNTTFIKKGEKKTLKTLSEETNYSEFVLKPTVSGAGRHTYKFNRKTVNKYDSVFKELIQEEDMMLQEFQSNIYKKGEAAFMVFNGKFSHAVLKKAKAGEFKVQDDFGGSVHHYTPSAREIQFAEAIVAEISPIPIYARVDIIWDNKNKPAVSELELIEPELWFRFYPPAADLLANAITKTV